MTTEGKGRKGERKRAQGREGGRTWACISDVRSRSWTVQALWWGLAGPAGKKGGREGWRAGRQEGAAERGCQNKERGREGRREARTWRARVGIHFLDTVGHTVEAGVKAGTKDVLVQGGEQPGREGEGGRQAGREGREGKRKLSYAQIPRGAQDVEGTKLLPPLLPSLLPSLPRALLLPPLLPSLLPSLPRALLPVAVERRAVRAVSARGWIQVGRPQIAHREDARQLYLRSREGGEGGREGREGKLSASTDDAVV